MIRARDKATNLMKRGTITKEEFENMWFVKEEAELKNFFELASVRVSMDETSEILDFSIDELIFLDPDGPRSHVSAPLNSSDIDMIWSGWNELRLLHEQFLKELRTLISMDVSVSHVLIAEKMIEHARRLRKPLGEYTANMIHVTPFIRSELRRNREFQRFCSERQKLDDSDGLPIDSMLIVPVQRPTRYLLLLKEMSKNIAAQDQDKINAAMDELKDLNTYFDECVSMERVLSLETRIDEPWLCLSQKGRGYIMDGVLRKTQDGMFGMESSHVRGVRDVRAITCITHFVESLEHKNANFMPLTFNLDFQTIKHSIGTKTQLALERTGTPFLSHVRLSVLHQNE